jgi:hypothetical protein
LLCVGGIDTFLRQQQQLVRRKEEEKKEKNKGKGCRRRCLVCTTDPADIVSVALFGLSVHLARRAEGVRGVVEPCTARDGENSYFDPHREGLGKTVAVTWVTVIVWALAWWNDRGHIASDRGSHVFNHCGGGHVHPIAGDSRRDGPSGEAKSGDDVMGGSGEAETAPKGFVLPEPFCSGSGETKIVLEGSTAPWLPKAGSGEAKIAP